MLHFVKLYVFESVFDSLFRSRKHLSSFVILPITFLFLLSACRVQTTETSTPVPNREVVITAWTAEAVGTILNVDGCIRIRNEETNIDYALVWTPDVSANIEGDEIRIILGIVRGNPRKIVLHFGDVVRVGGGETMYPDKQLLGNIHPSCQGPYWVVGFEIDSVQSTRNP